MPYLAKAEAAENYDADFLAQAATAMQPQPYLGDHRGVGQRGRAYPPSFVDPPEMTMRMRPRDDVDLVDGAGGHIYERPYSSGSPVYLQGYDVGISRV